MRLAVFTKNRTNPAYAAARIGAERTAARNGASAVHFVPDTADDVGQQTALIDEALRGGFDAFVFVPVPVTGMVEPLAKVLAKGMPVVTLLNRIAGDVVSFVGADDFHIGRGIAAHLAKALEGRGDVVILEGMPGSVTNTDRIRGFHAALDAHPGIRVAATLQGEYQQAGGREAMEAFLSRNPGRIDGVLSANDAMALGALEALGAKGLAPQVVGVNAVPDAITALKRGTLLATVDFDALRIACIATEAAIRHLRGERVPAEIMLPTQIVDRSNCAAWDKPLEERECPRWDEVVRP